MSGGARWKLEELRLLEELAGRKVSLHVTALKLERTVAAVEAKAAQLGIPLGRPRRKYTRRLSSQDSDMTLDKTG